MFERVIAQTIQKITAETLQERSLIPLVDILQDPRIPARIKPFFETEVHWWLYNDHLARAANKRFDYEHPELASLLNYLEQVQFRHARFEREEFVSVLDSAVKLIYNYLCRPQTTLKWYIFRGQPVKPLNEVMLRFSAFIDYEYFRTVFIEWVERKRAERPTFDAISATEFERVIRRTDDQILLHCTVEDLLDMMGPLFEFIGEGPEQKLPVDALIIFFDDKNIKKLVDQLEAYRDRGGGDVGRDDFVSLLDELLSTAEEGPEADFSNVYQNDELDDVVRQHLQGGHRENAPVQDGGDDPFADDPFADDPLWEEEPPQTEVPAPVPAAFREEPAEAHYPTEPFLSPIQEEEIPEDDLFEDDDDDDADEWPLDDDAAIDEELGISSAGDDTLHGAIRNDSFYAPGGERLYGVQESDDEPDLDFDDEDDDEIGGVQEMPPAAAATALPPASGQPSMISREAPGFGTSHDGAADEAEEPRSAGAVPSSGQSSPGMPLRETPAAEPVASNGVHHHQEQAPPAAQPQGYPAADPGEQISRGAARTETLPTVEPSAPAEPAFLHQGTGVPRTAPVMSDVRRFIDPALERKVVKKIFAKNRADYEVALDRLNTAPNWKMASQVLDELFLKFNVDPYSRTAIRFTDSVYGRYLP